MDGRRTSFGFLFFVSLFVVINTAAAQDWNQWRGPSRDGVVKGFSAPEVWPDDLEKVWKVPVGGGYASPVVVDGRIYTISRVGDEEMVTCFDLENGKVLWRDRYAAPFTPNRYATKQGKGPYSTPTLHNGKLFTLGVNGVLSCYDVKTGTLKWRQQFPKTTDTSKLFCGAAMSPIIEGQMCIVHMGDDFTGALVAYDIDKGEEVWRLEGDGPGYASPVIAEIGGARHMITLTDRSCIGVDPGNGTLRWRIPYEDEWNENIVMPVVFEDLVVLSGKRKATFAIRVAKKGEAWFTTDVWKNDKVAMYMSSPVRDNDKLYGLSSFKKGQFFCMDIRSGELLWTSEGRVGYNASILDGDGFLLCLTTGGNLIVVKKNTEHYEQIRNYEVASSAVWSHPVVMADRILVKDMTALVLWRIK